LEYARPFLRGSNWNAFSSRSRSARYSRALVRAAQSREEVDGLAARQVRPDAHVAGHVGDAPVQRRGVPPGVAAEDGRFARGLAREAEADADGGGLACAVRAEEAVHLTGGHLEIEAVEGVHASVALGEAARADHSVHVDAHCAIS